MITVTTNVRFTKTTKGRKRLRVSDGPAEGVRCGRIPRISKLMALAIRFDGLLRSGVVADMSELARLARVTQPRMTQIMNLNHLAPDIQEAILFLSATGTGKERLHERMLRRLVAEVSWSRQAEQWRAIRNAG